MYKKENFANLLKKLNFFKTLNMCEILRDLADTFLDIKV